MKKLLDREPTKEMIRAAYERFTASALTASWGDIWQSMFDAAPEVKVGMEPVAEIGWLGELHRMIKKDMPGGTLLYSATQLATLQAENERLTAERDELIAVCIDELKRAKLISNPKKFEFARQNGLATLDDVHAWMVASATRLEEVVAKHIAKHEGDKHADKDDFQG